MQIKLNSKNKCYGHKTINFCNNNIVEGLTSMAKIKFGYPENDKYVLTNNLLVNRAIGYLMECQ